MLCQLSYRDVDLACESARSDLVPQAGFEPAEARLLKPIGVPISIATGGRFGWPGRGRICDLRINSAALYQLSYWPKCWWIVRESNPVVSRRRPDLQSGAVASAAHDPNTNELEQRPGFEPSPPVGQTGLSPRTNTAKVVSVAGLEPAASCSQSKRSTN